MILDPKSKNDHLYFIFYFYFFWQQDYLCDIAYVHMVEIQQRRAPGAAPRGVPRLASGTPFTHQSKGAGVAARLAYGSHLHLINSTF